jgi:hypothetical protein
MTENEGFPDTADPDSTAFERPEDELDPPALPGDEPLGLDEPEEETLDERLAEEQPDIAEDDRPLTPEEVAAPPVRAHPEREASMYDTGFDENSIVDNRGGAAEEDAVHEEPE